MTNETRKLKNNRACTLEEVAMQLEVTIERARCIEKSALQKCRSWCILHGHDLETLLASLGTKTDDTCYELHLDDDVSRNIED